MNKNKVWKKCNPILKAQVLFSAILSIFTSAFLQWYALDWFIRFAWDKEINFYYMYIPFLIANTLYVINLYYDSKLLYKIDYELFLIYSFIVLVPFLFSSILIFLVSYILFSPLWLIYWLIYTVGYAFRAGFDGKL
jgi:hypothetical protein